MLLVNLDKIPTDRAAYGSKVVLYEYETDKEVEYQLVTAEESNISQGTHFDHIPDRARHCGKDGRG